MDKTIIRINKGNRVSINWHNKNFKDAYNSGYLTDIQISFLKSYAKTKDFACLGDFLNCRNDKNKYDYLVICALMWAFSNREDISIIIDNSYERKVSEIGIGKFNRLLKKARNKPNVEKRKRDYQKLYHRDYYRNKNKVPKEKWRA